MKIRLETLKPVLERASKRVMYEMPLITTAAAIAGTVGVAVLASKAGVQAHQVLRLEEHHRKTTGKEPMTWQDKTKMTWKFYVPTAITVCLTAASVIALNRVGYRRAAAATALYTSTKQIYDEYRKSVEESVSPETAQEIKEKATQKRVDRSKNSSTEVIITGDEVLFMDSYSGRYFKSTVEDIRSYVNDINAEVIGSLYASLTEFYDKIGLEPTASSDEVGWNSDALMQVDFEAAMAENNRPCLVVNYTPFPVTGYDRSL